MENRTSLAAKVRFGPYEFDPSIGELRKHGIRIKLQGKPLQMLTALLEAQGQVVGRDELRQRLWPSEAFVDSESGLNTAAKRLRDALTDSAESPRYIETLPRTGYRFIAPLEPDSKPLYTPAPIVPVPAATERSRSLSVWIGGAALLAVLAAVAFFFRPTAEEATFRQITFQRSQVWASRFGPDGQTVIYSAQRESDPRQVFVSNGVSPESRPLDNLSGAVISVSRRGDLALVTPSGSTPLAGSTLSRAHMNGGDALELERGIMSADFGPDGSRMALARAANGAYQLEFPAGTVLYRTSGWLSSVRVHASGDRIAFVHHPVRHDDSGSVELVDLNGKARTLVKDWATIAGLAWHPATGEIWFTGSRNGAVRSVWAVSESGRIRPVAQAPGSLTLNDIAPSGRVLVTRESRRLEMALANSANGTPAEITWFDWSRLQEISADGSLILFDESGEGAGGRPVTFLYRTRNKRAVKLAEGTAMGLSLDNQWALIRSDVDRTQLTLVPVGPGQPRHLPPSGLSYQWARFLPDGQNLLALASEPGQPLRLFRVPLHSGKPAAISPPIVVRNSAVSPDGGRVAVMDANSRLVIYNTLESGAGRVLPTSAPLAPILWTSSGLPAGKGAAAPQSQRGRTWPSAASLRFAGESLLVQEMRSYTEIPARLYRMDVETGRLLPWREVMPRDTVGVNAITRILVTPDLATWAFNYRRVQSELFVVDGWR